MWLTVTPAALSSSEQILVLCSSGVNLLQAKHLVFGLWHVASVTSKKLRKILAISEIVMLFYVLYYLHMTGKPELKSAY